MKNTKKLCVFFTDKEAPTVVYCPEDQYVKIVTGTAVTWPEPQFTDNVGVTSVDVFPYKPPALLSANDHKIEYTAKDQAGNHAVCRFKVIVTGEYCDTDAPSCS
jgi:hydroxyacyl-ACP dehydratase HTD2-like protein with hotdog domain